MCILMGCCGFSGKSGLVSPDSKRSACVWIYWVNMKIWFRYWNFEYCPLYCLGPPGGNIEGYIPRYCRLNYFGVFFDMEKLLANHEQNYVHGKLEYRYSESNIDDDIDHCMNFESNMIVAIRNVEWWQLFGAAEYCQWNNIYETFLWTWSKIFPKHKIGVLSLKILSVYSNFQYKRWDTVDSFCRRCFIFGAAEWRIGNELKRYEWRVIV